MQETWRWFGPNDQTSLIDVVQAGARGIVTSLHHVPTGAAWSADEIAKRQQEIRAGSGALVPPLEWSVVESLPVSEDIKRQTGSWRAHIEAYRSSLRELAAAGIEVICYNFMPVLDWTRTDLSFELATGATCMRFDLIDFIMFDLFLLERPGAAEDFAESDVEAARRRFASVDDAFKAQLVRNIVCGLPGAAENFTIEDIKAHLDLYASIDHDRLAQNQYAFLEQVAPLAEELGLRLCCHPDDPPVPLLGLPRVMSVEADYQSLIDAVDLPANGITLCSGSLGARSDNDLPGMMARLGHRVHFLHLRNVAREHENVFGSFHEAEHLAGDTNMAALITEVLAEETRRRDQGRADCSIPFRPDHGQDIVDDLGRKTQPGYPTIGRLKGLAELRGVIEGVRYSQSRAP